MISYPTGNHVTSCGISGYSTGSDMTPTGQKKIIANDLPSREKNRKG